MTVRVRFAPSPTGFLHVGGARTALYNWLWARHNNGTMILRIEDTDTTRSTEASVDQIFESLKWLGLDWDEGPYFQTQRMDLYRRDLQRMVESGAVYPAFETPEELDAMREKARAEGRNPIYDRSSLRLPPEEVRRRIDSGMPYVWRFKCPPGITNVPETLMSGEADCHFDNEALGDFVMTRACVRDEWGAPLYNFCCAVDDADMKITHVIRGADHLTNTARQIMMLEALGYPVPMYTHLPLILKANKKMSKRDADADPRYPVSVSARRDLGYLPEATINFIALLGWSFDDKTEVFTREELIKSFSLDKLSKSNANFDEDKYLYMNGWYLRNMPRESVLPDIRRFLAAVGFTAGERGDQWLDFIVGLEIERCRLLADFAEALEYFFRPPATFDPKGVRKLFDAGSPALLRELADCLAGVEPFTQEALETSIRAFADGRGLGFGKIAQPMRLALTGRTATPGLFDVLVGLGREACLDRLRGVAGQLEAGSLPVTEG